MRILLVEDSPEVSLSVREILSGVGHDVADASNGKEALDRISDHGLPTLILLDLIMPEMNGIQFVGELRKIPGYRDVTTIVVTGKELTEEDRRALNGDVMDIIHKDEHTSDELMAEVEEMIHSAVGTGGSG